MYEKYHGTCLIFALGRKYCGEKIKLDKVIAKGGLNIY